VRARDRVRERAVRRLRSAYVEGALSTGTFELRVASAYRSRSRAELSHLLADLPSPRAWLRALVAHWLGEAPDAAALEGVETTDVALPAVAGGRLVIGRSSRCDVVLRAPAISRLHLEITYGDGRWQAWDLGSTNGSYVDGRRVQAADVRPGDVLVLGDAAVRLVGPA
jgi:hypothetical protein